MDTKLTHKSHGFFWGVVGWGGGGVLLYQSVRLYFHAVFTSLMDFLIFFLGGGGGGYLIYILYHCIRLFFFFGGMFIVS